jgi:hypothetical protein
VDLFNRGKYVGHQKFRKGKSKGSNDDEADVITVNDVVSKINEDVWGNEIFIEDSDGTHNSVSLAQVEISKRNVMWSIFVDIDFSVSKLSEHAIKNHGNMSGGASSVLDSEFTIDSAGSVLVSYASS